MKLLSKKKKKTPSTPPKRSKFTASALSALYLAAHLGTFRSPSHKPDLT
jgi:hypothetical protein